MEGELLQSARDGSRTHTPFQITDFESVASAIPPPGLGRISYRSLLIEGANRV